MIGIEVMHDAAKRGDLGVRISVGAQDIRKRENGEQSIGLAIGEVHFRGRIRGEILLHAADDADDFTVRNVFFGSGADLDVFSQWRFAGEKLTGHGFVYDSDEGVFFGVGVGEHASLQQGDVKRVEIAGADGAIADSDVVMRGLGRATLDIEMDDGPATADGEIGGGSYGADSGKSREAFSEAVKKFHALRRLREGFLRKRNIGDKKFGGLETGLDILEALEAAEKQSRADEENESERDFDDNERAAKLRLASATGRPARGFIKHAAQIEMGGLEGGCESKENSGEESDDGDEGQDLRVNPDRPDIGDGASGELPEWSDGEPGKEKSGDGAREGKEDAFREELAKDTSTAGTDGHADGNFAAASGSAREKKIGDVGAGDEENESDSAEKDVESRPNILNDLVVQADCESAEVGVIGGILRFQALGDGGEFDAGLVKRGSGLEASDGDDAGMPVAVVGKSPGPRLEGNHDINGLEELEIGRKDAGDGVGKIVESDGPADGVMRAAELALPEAVGEKDDGRASGAIFFGKESVSFERSDAEEREKIRAGHLSCEALRLARAGESEGGVVEAGHTVEGSALVAEINEVKIGRADNGRGGNALVHEDEA